MTEKENKLLAELLKKEKPERDAQEKILDIVKSNGALEYTYKKAEEFSLKSKKIIAQFSKSIYRDSLTLLPDFVLKRKK